MPFTMILLVAILLVLIGAVYYIILNLKRNKRYKAISIAVGFVVLLALLYGGVISFITSM